MILQESKSVPRNLTYAQVYACALEFFNHDKDKTNHWWLNKHEELSGLSPYEMVKQGKGRKLVRLIEKCR